MINRHEIRAVSLLVCVMALLTGLNEPVAAELRVWTDSTGRHRLEGTLKDFDQSSGTVFLTMPNGKRKLVEYGRLSGVDQEFVLVHAPAVHRVDRPNLTSTADATPSTSSATLANVLTVLYSNPKYQPITPERIGQSKRQLRESMAAMERKMATWGEQEAAWKKYLHWDALNARIGENEYCDLDLLKKVSDLLRVDHPGLERNEFLDLRSAISHHMRNVQFAGVPEDASQHSKRIQELEHLLTAEMHDSNPANIEQIGLHLGWLDERGQLSADVDTIRRSYSLPNVYLRVSKEMLASRASRSVGEATGVRDVILGTSVVGRGYTTGQISLRPIADHRRAVFDLHLDASTTTNTVGYHDAIRIYSNGRTDVAATKRFVIDSEGIHGLAASSSANTSTRTRDIETDLPPVINLFVRRIAEREVERNQASADAIAAGRARVQFNERLDREANRFARTANEYYHDRIRNPLLRSDSFPRQVELATTSDALLIKALQDDSFHLGAPGLPPDSFRQSDLGICLYESAINGWLANSLAGTAMRQSELWNKLSDWLPRIAPEAINEDEEIEITFDDVQPLTVYARDEALTLTIRGQRFFARKQDLPAMNISVRYDLQQREDAWYLVLHGEPAIEPPRVDRDDKERLSLKELTLRRLLINRLDRDLPKEILIERLRFERPGIGIVELNCARLAAECGWFTAVLDLPRKAPDAR